MPPAADTDAQVELDGHLLKLTNLGKVLYPMTGTTKADVIGYYAEVAHAMLPHVQGRPVTRKRWPNGVQEQPFFHKNIDKGVPPWVPRMPIAHRSGTTIYPMIDSPATLAWFGQNASLEIHVPQWRFTPDGDVGKPDRLVFDLDPGPGVELPDCARVALVIRDHLGAQGIRCVPVTSGSKGIHLYSHLDGSLTSDEASDFAHALAEELERKMPDTVVSRMTKSLRPGKIFLDWSQNSAAKTTIAPYSLRGRARPTVAAPRTWDELEDPDLDHLDFREVLRRLESGSDPMDGLETGRRPRRGSPAKPAPAPTASPAKPAGAPMATEDKLATYRAKRSADRTPEPVPERADLPQGNDDTFVIQEHHARALHWDFRLERDGVLVSWAVPRGIPTDVRQNRLAVQTEDHPLEYADFAGTIPRGEYGGGWVTIWDSGSYTTEKWRPGEVIVELHGQKARGRFALIRTRDKQWLMHRTKGQPDLPEVVPLPESDAPTDGPVWTRDGRQDPAASAAAAKPVTGTAGEGARRPVPGADIALPNDLAPMLATAGTVGDLGADHQWRLEAKWDGVRALAWVTGGTVRLTSRNGNDMTAVYPELAAIADWLAGHSAVLDGEVVALNEAGRSDFGLLQQRMKLTKRAEIERVREQVPVRFFAFDVLHLDGISLLNKRFDDRRRVLEVLGEGGPHIAVPELLSGSVDDALQYTREREWEGVVAKAAESVYQSGRRARTWIKIKNFRTQEVVVVGWRPGNGRRSGSIGSLLLGIPGRSGFEYVGRVGSGFSDRDLDDVAHRLEPLARKTTAVVGEMPRMETRDARWVRPVLVGEVRFSEWSRDGLLRQASWRGFRPDKDPLDVHRE